MATKNSDDLEYDMILDKIDTISQSKLMFLDELKQYKTSALSDKEIHQQTMDYIFGNAENPFEDVNKVFQSKMDDYDATIETLTNRAATKLKGKKINK